ncbi:MAG: FecR domain-containing protein [Prevotellaceae bacterium]|jgi:ferric-dicitrate binding protein FerR (iron transport regulator)|nr:FecR domain-containing protein [Prevotellaceae bacterium]
MEKTEYIELFEKYLNGTAIESEKERLRAFVLSNNRIDKWFSDEIAQSSAGLDAELRQKMWREIRGATSAEKEPQLAQILSSAKRLVRIAAAILLPLALIFGTYFILDRNSTNRDSALIIRTERGEKANIMLPDGSRVWLNSDSEIKYNAAYNKSERLIRFSGEAFFEIKHNSEKKFIVQCADNAQIEVLGTKFNVKSYKNDSLISVVLASGKVKFSASNISATMRQSERLIFNKNIAKITVSSVANADHFTAWRNNRLRFENETLAGIAATISRMHNIDCKFKNETVKNIRFTGTLDNTSLHSLLNALTITAPITYALSDSAVVFAEL